MYARFFCAFTFLTRLPLPGASRIDFTPAVLRGSVVYYPVVGLFYALVTVGLWLGGRALGLPADLGALAVFAAPYFLNRFLHFDGLCDVLDGFLADRTPEQRLAIMKDSRNGSFAMGGAVLAMLTQFLLVRQLWESGDLLVLALAPVAVRWLVVALAYRAVYPRATGTAFHLVGQVSLKHWLLTGVSAAAMGGLLIAGFFVLNGASAAVPLPALALSLGLTLAWLVWLRGVSHKKIGGVTGDVLGCFIDLGTAVWLLGGVLL